MDKLDYFIRELLKEDKSISVTDDINLVISELF